MSNVQAVAFSFVERLAQDLKDERLELPAFPEAVLRIQQALQSSDTDTGDIVRILSSEPALAARLLLPLADLGVDDLPFIFDRTFLKSQ